MSSPPDDLAAISEGELSIIVGLWWWWLWLCCCSCRWLDIFIELVSKETALVMQLGTGNGIW